MRADDKMKGIVCYVFLQLLLLQDVMTQTIPELDLKGRDLDIEKKINIGFAKPPTSLPDTKERQAIIKEVKKSLGGLGRSSRTKKLNISLEEARKNWLKENGPEEIKRIAEHYGVYESLYQHGYFLPYLPINIYYDYDAESVTPVYHGNIIYAKETQSAPTVKFNSGPEDLWTLVLTNPDGHLEDNNSEYLHWLVANIKGGDLSTGETIVDYLRPIPYLGTGYHRYIFVLYKQDGRLDFSQYKKEQPCLNLPDRTFKTYDFYKSHQQELTPASLAFFQSVWDTSVKDFLHHTLKMKEPHFEYVQPPDYFCDQTDYPHLEPFNLYLDKYRPPKDLRKEVFLKRMSFVDPFKDEPPKAKFPNIKTSAETYDTPEWRWAVLWKQDNRIGRFRELEPYSAYPRPPFKPWTGRRLKSTDHDELGNRRVEGQVYYDTIVNE
ncbi:MRPL38 [Cordylochernes scorpioides]|uniref:Large ribosomal subunit protein mL38 n=1 Tax=Cordylochernes scorpioides TaxID=51811 RepID=A0ABY6JZT6_9ARAC|nr:MRPL38 [Cordylochernes scorpioides]